MTSLDPKDVSRMEAGEIMVVTTPTVPTYESAIEEVLAKMVKRAGELGANAVVGAAFSEGEQVTAFGTAVRY